MQLGIVTVVIDAGQALHSSTVDAQARAFILGGQRDDGARAIPLEAPVAHNAVRFSLAANGGFHAVGVAGQQGQHDVFGATNAGVIWFARHGASPCAPARRRPRHGGSNNRMGWRFAHGFAGAARKHHRRQCHGGHDSAAAHIKTKSRR